ncbi:MAG: CDGSH iron-sulfur domain-containing protein [Balneolaceae bacterium]
MNSKIFSYENENVEVTWDKHRCIHAKECVHGLPEVFDISKKPWINPDGQTDIEKLKEVIGKCPTGALMYKLANGDIEPIPSTNTITIVEDGPVYVEGDILIQDTDGNELLKDIRVALCRCGASSNKPLCDNAHLKKDFKADDSYNPERLLLEPTEHVNGPLTITMIPNGPFVVNGNYEVHGKDSSVTKTEKKMSFCRCGASTNKPFCDGTHRSIGFEA